MKHNINISIVNTPLGVATSSDGVMMIFCKATAVSTTFALNTAYLLTKADDITTLGLTSSTDSSNGVAIYQQASEFYSQAGDGAKLWLVGVAKSTTFSTFVVSNTFKNLIRGTTLIDPLNRAKMIGICFEVPTSSQIATDFPADVMDTLTALQTTQAALFSEGYQFSFLIDGYNMSATITPSTLTTLATKGKSSGSVCISGTAPNGVSSVGLAFGRFARISIGHGFGCVEDGATTAVNAYLTNGCATTIAAGGTLTAGVTYKVAVGAITYDSVVYNIGDSFVCASSPLVFTTSASGVVNAASTDISKMFYTDIDLLGEKQFLFLRPWFNHSGYYWNDGATAELSTKPLSTQEFNRVANRIASDALGFLIDTIGKNVPINSTTGLVDDGYVSTLQEKFYDDYLVPLKSVGGSGDITDGSITLVGTPTGTQVAWTFQIKIIPTPIIGSATGTIEFTYTL